MVGCDEGKNCYMSICLDVMKIELLYAYMLVMVGCDEDRTAMILVFISHDFRFHLPSSFSFANMPCCYSFDMLM
jgi:hypothetical protein